MTLIRAVGRTMLASYFIASGIKAVRKPSLYVEEAEPVTDKLVPALKKYAPAQVAGYIPEDTATLVRINGVLQVAGGAMLATGKGRRLGSWLLAYSLVPATLARHPFWKESDPALKSAERSAFLKNVSLLGGVVLAARDTEGQPGLRWRTADAAHSISRGGQSASKSISKSASKTAASVGDSISDGAEAAVAGGIALAGLVAKETGRARKKAAKAAKKQSKVISKNAPKVSRRVQKQTAKATKLAGERAEKLQKAASKQAAIAAKKAKPLQKKAAKQAELAAKKAKPLQKKAAKQAELAAKKAKPYQKAAVKQAHSLGSDLAHRAADVRKSVEKTAGEVGKHIELGNN